MAFYIRAVLHIDSVYTLQFQSIAIAEETKFHKQLARQIWELLFFGNDFVRCVLGVCLLNDSEFGVAHTLPHTWSVDDSRVIIPDDDSLLPGKLADDISVLIPRRLPKLFANLQRCIV